MLYKLRSIIYLFVNNYHIKLLFDIMKRCCIARVKLHNKL